MEEDKKYYTIGSLTKAFSVIDIMSNEAKWELGRLAKASGLPKGTLQRILLTLVELGFVSRNNGEYALTLRFYRLGQRIASNNKILEHARPFCRQVMGTINETINLCIAINTDMVVVDQQVSWQMLRLDSVVGSSFPIFQSASGKAYAAFLDELHLLKLIEAIRRERPDIPQVEIDRFLAELALTRRDGLGFDFEEIFQGVRCVAAPVFDYSGEVVATVGTSIPTVRITEQLSRQAIAEISACAMQISQVIGAHPRNFLPCSRTMLGAGSNTQSPVNLQTRQA